MKLALLERFFILSPLRPLLHRHLEAKQLFALGGPVDGGRVLEIGCGPGGGIGLIFDRFGAGHLDVFDIDPKMVSAASRRARPRPGQLNFWVANVRQIPVPSASYDAVFNFGVIHHVQQWRLAVAEIFRILKPGGKFYCEEIHKRWITHPVIGRLMTHPQIDRFDGEQFVEALHEAGFRVHGVKELWDLYIWVVASKPLA